MSIPGHCRSTLRGFSREAFEAGRGPLGKATLVKARVSAAPSALSTETYDALALGLFACVRPTAHIDIQLPHAAAAAHRQHLRRVGPALQQRARPEAHVVRADAPACLLYTSPSPRD